MHKLNSRGVYKNSKSAISQLHTVDAVNREMNSGILGKQHHLPCTLDDVDLSCLPADFHILGQNEQYFFRANTPYQMQYPLQL